MTAHQGLLTPAPRPTVTLGQVVLGVGRPKVCVPLVARTVNELTSAAAALPVGACDLVELRIDFFDGVDDAASVNAALGAVRAALPGDIPILFTFRSAREGGEREISPEDYEALVALAVAAGVDAVDVEMFTEREILSRIVSNAHAAGVRVVMSSHDFEKTPSRDDIVARLAAQQNLGADVVKIAVMPRSPRDVITLMDATELFVATAATCPVITMSMGGLGVISRLAGETYGSCLSFGSAGAPSAPGQIDAVELMSILTTVHAAR
jgi:3-dehydroquinate dehydratase-1